MTRRHPVVFLVDVDGNATGPSSRSFAPIWASSWTGAHRESAEEKDRVTRTLYTIGHSTRSTRELVDLLRAHGVEQVVDVRTLPKRVTTRSSTALRYRVRSTRSR
jgi:hypothetical protein